MSGGGGGTLAQQRLFEMSPSRPTQSAHAAGDFSENTNAAPGGSAAWYDAPVFTTTLTAPLVVGNTTASVAACPTVTLTTGLFVSDMGASAAGIPQTLSGYLSCTATTMTFNGPATKAGASGDTIKVLNWMLAAPISNDPANPDYTMTTVRSGVSSNTELTGRITLAAGTATYTLVGVYASAPNCITSDATTPANASSVSESSTTLTFTGTGTDVIKYICAGRN